MESIIKKLGKTSVTVEKDYHSSEKEYNKLTIVEEEGTFKTYLSRKPVPIGTELTNREYWIPFSGVLESITFDYLKFKKDYASGKAIEDNAIITRHVLNRNIERIKIALKAISEEEIDDNAIIERTIKDRNVTSNKIAKENILTEHLAKKSVITSILADYIITAIKLADNSVTTRSIADENITDIKLANNSVTTRSIAQESIIEEKFANNSVSTRSLIDKSVTKEKLAENSVTESKIADNNITNCKIANNTIDITKFDSYTRNIIESVRYIPEEFASIKEAIFDEINKYKPIVINGDVINAADEEDITSENNLLKLKDRSSINGMGYIILRKNKSFAEQVTKKNTIYEIRYDFDLNGAEITIPENCALNFNGGKLENGTLVGDNTKVNCDLYFTIFNKIIIKGNFLIEKLTPQNFGAIADGTFDCSDIFKQLEELPYNVFIPRGLYKVNNLKINSKEWHFEASGSAHWFDENCAKILTSTGVAISGGPIIYNLFVEYNGNEVDRSKRGVGISLTTHWAEIHRAFVSNFNVGILLGGTDHCDYTRLYNVNSWYNYYAGIKIDHSDRAQVNFISIFDCNSGSNGVDVHNKEVEPNITRGFGIYLNGGNSIYINNADVSSNECAGIYIDTPTTLQAVRGLKVSTIYAEHNKYCNIYYNNKENRSTFIDITNTYFYNDETDKYFKRDVIYSDNEIKIPGIKFSNALPVQNHFNYGSLLREDTDYISKIPLSYVRPNTIYEIKIKIKAKEIGDLVLQNEYRGIKYTNSAFLITSRISLGPARTLTVSSTDISEYTIYIKTPQSDSAYILYNTLDYGVKYELIDIALKELPYSSGSSADRPSTAKTGFMYFDTTKKKPIWKVDDILNDWVDATGQTI